MRLNLFIAKSGVASRRGADALIKNGKVRVNSKVIFQPYYQVKEGDNIFCQGRCLSLKENIYIIMNKPKGVTTTLKDPFAEKKITDLLPLELTTVEGKKTDKRSLYPVGRLDKNSTGLMILTNDGRLCFYLTHPKFSVEKEYLVKAKGQLLADELIRFKKGVVSEGEVLKARRIKIISSNKGMTFCSVVITEGKKRHIRRMFKALGLPVKQLHRIRIAGLKLGSLKKGDFKVMKKNDIFRILGLELKKPE
ncbi:MAG: rRNA pseudouridine synthase [Candidatus Omnitrophica bacterium]|nr:rRNA pseudouridine synthase [Candidatus Omnitrophota bacterium]